MAPMLSPDPMPVEVTSALLADAADVAAVEVAAGVVALEMVELIWNLLASQRIYRRIAPRLKQKPYQPVV
jgi:hypothetical protein